MPLAPFPPAPVPAPPWMVPFPWPPLPVQAANPSGTAFGSGAAASLTATVTVPSGSAAGDLLILYAARGTAATTWTAPGFTAVPAATGTNGACQVLWRLLDGSASDPQGTFTITCSQSALFAGVCLRVQRAAPGFDPAPTSGQVNVSGTSLPAPGITTTVNGDLLIWCGGIDASNVIAPTLVLPAGYTDCGAGQSNTTAAAGTNMGVVAGTVVQGSAGATGTVTGTSPAAHVNMAVLLGVAFTPLTLGGAAAIAGAAAVTANVTQGASAAAAAAGAVTANITVSATATVAGAAAVTSAVTQGVTVPAAAAGTVTGNVTQAATAAAAGAASVSDVATQAVIAALAGAGTVTAQVAAAGSTAAIAGASAVTANAVQIVTGTAPAAGAVTATGTTGLPAQNAVSHPSVTGRTAGSKVTELAAVAPRVSGRSGFAVVTGSTGGYPAAYTSTYAPAAGPGSRAAVVRKTVSVAGVSGG